MNSLAIQELELRYRLPGGGEAARDRLDRVLGSSMEELLEAAVDRAGISSQELIALRELDAPATVDLSSSDWAIAAAWARAFAAALERAVRRGGEGVVRYRSVHAALLDVALRTARGDLRRIWAWRSLGLWRPEPDAAPSPRDAAGEVSAAVVQNPAAAPGVVRALADEGLLGELWAHLLVEEIRELAGAVLRNSGADPMTAASLIELRAWDGGEALSRGGARSGAAGGERSRAEEDAARGSALADAQEPERVLRDSPVARYALQAHRVALRAGAEPRRERTSCRVLSLLALEDVSPGFATSPRARARLDAVEDLIHRKALAASEPNAVAKSSSNPGAGVEGARHAPSPAEAAAASPKPAPPEELEALARTRHAGLLFLLNLLRDPALRSPLAEDARLAARPWRWTLHRLGMTLGSVDPGDPAALAFCGLGPRARPPSRGEPPPAPEEEEAIAAGAAALKAALRERLDVAAPELRLPSDEALLAFVCRRRGVVLDDPGWLEIRMDLDEVSTELRRAGLDLDPGWLPWLGAVVRFSYA